MLRPVARSSYTIFYIRSILLRCRSAPAPFWTESILEYLPPRCLLRGTTIVDSRATARGSKSTLHERFDEHTAATIEFHPHNHPDKWKNRSLRYNHRLSTMWNTRNRRSSTCSCGTVGERIRGFQTDLLRDPCCFS
jgi:hypothetical protein